MLMYFEPASMCTLQTVLVLAPLPAKKQLWEAGSEHVWKAESERESGAQTAFALTANGELVKLEERQPCYTGTVLLYKPSEAWTRPGTTSPWEEWCSGMDGFGGLVMLTASLIA